MWLSGYYNGKRKNTIIEPDAVKKNEAKVNLYCYQHREATVMDAAKNVLGFDKRVCAAFSNQTSSLMDIQYAVNPRNGRCQNLS